MTMGPIQHVPLPSPPSLPAVVATTDSALLRPLLAVPLSLLRIHTPPTPKTGTATALVLALTYLGLLVTYRLYFHPLSRVPGPRLAAVTKLYQTYYAREYFKQIGALHERYGPVVRINPNEIHLSGVDEYDRIYHVGSNYVKDAVYYGSTTVDRSTFGTVHPEVHRIKRGAMNPMFSRKMVLQLEPLVQDKAAKLCAHVQRAIDAGVPCDLHHGFRAVATDVVSAYTFDRSYDLLDRQDLGAEFYRTINGVGPAVWAFQYSTWLRDFAMSLPKGLTDACSSALRAIEQLRRSFVVDIEAVKARKATQGLGDRRPTIFTTLLDEAKKPYGYVVPSTLTLTDEAYSIMIAGSDTSGNAMTVAAFQTLRNPGIYERITGELNERFPDPESVLGFADLEGLPYLTALIKESLRLSFGVPGRLPRVVPAGGALFNGYHVPAGTVVAMSSWMMHRDPQVWGPDPMRFDPEGWLDGGTAEGRSKVRALERGFVPFSRGTRQCVGMQLAYAEIYVTLGTFFRRFQNLKVYKTTEWDMEYIDVISSYHIAGRNWLKAVSKA